MRGVDDAARGGLMPPGVGCILTNNFQKNVKVGC